MKCDFNSDRIFAAGLSYKEKAGRVSIVTRKPVVRIITLILVLASIWVTIALPPYLKNNSEFWWVIPGLWIVSLLCAFLFALPHTRICYYAGKDFIELYTSLFKKPQKMYYSEIDLVKMACFTQASDERIREPMMDTVVDSVAALVLPIDLIRHRVTFEEDVFAICFVLTNCEKIFTHFTWDKLSAKNAVAALQHEI
jgi:hypothetical protein